MWTPPRSGASAEAPLGDDWSKVMRCACHRAGPRHSWGVRGAMVRSVVYPSLKTHGLRHFPHGLEIAQMSNVSAYQ